MTVKYYPINDGRDHINIYSKGHTELGRALSHFSNYPVTIYGTPYRTLESFWYHTLLNEIWATGICSDASLADALKSDFAMLSAFEAKSVGKGLLKRLGLDPLKILPIDPELGVTPHFKEVFTHAMQERVRQHPHLVKLLKESGVLPFTHYYYYGAIENPKIIDASKYKWMLEENENIRQNLYRIDAQ